MVPEEGGSCWLESGCVRMLVEGGEQYTAWVLYGTVDTM